ncbi:3-mercaptopyruvate sulfurtransferase [Sphingomonas sp. M1-B02]|uniref:3-mercaptopyruvate sulfurtransferase n=1 Tax=Sphingomonas sp. M1-B02 TaxID=3114300 RepID=UPI00223F0378|nr:3-mercaptopyruvate sulfurtransferase [Sphingomonas sp. S6-11]UZK65639.1 3-mercaptopyruvate sulfurtransferase [Sphingomonas sp. S6-11]
MESLVTTEWLADALAAPDLLLLDASYTSTLPGSPTRDPRAEYEAAHIPGARFLDLDTLVDTASPLPSMLPTRDAFAARMRELGVTADTRIVLYDGGPHHTSCRAWWVLRMFGVDASLLDGGIDKWRAEQRAMQSGFTPVSVSDFTPGPARGQVRTLAEMRANLESGAEQVADARSAARFTGDEPDPRPSCGSGHIPGARNIPYGLFFEADGTWKQPDEIARIFADAGIDPAKPLAATCGSGITAAVIVFAAHLLGHDAALYDGSWSEWGADPSAPKAMGPA